MAISGKLKTLLDTSRIRYTVATHPVAYTAQEIAASQHVPGRQLAKSVLVLTNRGPALAVLSATALIDLKRLKAALRASSLSLAKESDIKRHFPDVEIGAMTPFGHLYQVPVIVDHALGESDEIVFNAGSHTDTVRMRYRDFVALAQPKTARFGQSAGTPRSASAPARPRTRRPTPSRAKPPSRAKASGLRRRRSPRPRR